MKTSLEEMLKEAVVAPVATPTVNPPGSDPNEVLRGDADFDDDDEEEMDNEDE